MNRERLADLADIIENDRLPHVCFDMRVPASRDHFSAYPCGTIACIAGYAVCAAYGNVRAKQMTCQFGVLTTAANILDLNHRESERLFKPLHWFTTPSYYTKADAVRVLRHAAKTGVIDWNVGKKEIAA